ncbi:MAG: preprotein translocase subunit SecG [Simkaniaceae bacterium]|nr:preprotein translocase subunit SecG [Simkaniaceae bacterium]
MTALFYVVLFLFLLLSALLCSVILVQESKSLGLGASFGGDNSNSLFGTSTADVLKTITGYLALVFVVLCVLLSVWSSSLGRTPTPLIPESIEETVR